MSCVNPSDPIVAGALSTALLLAEDFWPVTDREQRAQLAIIDAVRSGDLEQVLEATRQARGLGTLAWRRMQANYVQAVERQIFKPLRQAPQEAA